MRVRAASKLHAWWLVQSLTGKESAQLCCMLQHALPAGVALLACTSMGLA